VYKNICKEREESYVSFSHRVLWCGSGPGNCSITNKSIFL